MPFQSRSNNRILPANARAVDVAKQTLRDIIPVEQRRYQNAFEVQGYETIVYQRLWHGVACSCSAHRSVSAGYLDEEGKLDAGTMDGILSGGMEFKVRRYGARTPNRSDLKPVESKFEDGQLMDGDEFNDRSGFDIVSDDTDDVFASTVTDQIVTGANGVTRPTDMDDASAIFDGELELNDTKCGVCMGTGYVGGYSVLNGLRIVLHTASPQITKLSGTKEFNQVPHAFFTDEVEFQIVLPKGAVAFDALRVWNNDVQAHPESIEIDNLPFSPELLMALCNGLTHTIRVTFSEMSYFTHLELQLNLSRTKALFELPRLAGGSDTKLQDATDDVSINASPSIPHLKREDVLVESTFGKALIVQSCNPWNDKDRSVLGWDVQTRVIQPEELLNNLPRRGVTHQKSTYLVRDNMRGIRRT